MRKAVIFSAFALSAFFTASATSFAQNPKKLFNVPFFIENINSPAPNALRADFQHPAILESFSMTCAGSPNGGLLLVDEGPLGVQGTTGVGSNSQVGLVVGPPANAMVRIDFIATAIGNTVYPPTPLRLPVKSAFSFILFPNAPHTAQCFGNVVFQSLN
jgi:hypothetical protein